MAQEKACAAGGVADRYSLLAGDVAKFNSCKFRKISRPVWGLLGCYYSYYLPTDSAHRPFWK
jgi:hypothetical protein